MKWKYCIFISTYYFFCTYITNWFIPIFLVAKCRIGAVFAYDLIEKIWTFWEWQQRKGLSKKDFFYKQDRNIAKAKKAVKGTSCNFMKAKFPGGGTK